MTAKSVTSSRSGRRRSNHVFHADPPLNKQSDQISKYFQEIIKILGKESDFNNSNDSNQSSMNEASFANLATKISDSIHKLFCDTWRSIRASQKADDKDEEISLKKTLQDQFNLFEANMSNLRKEQISFMTKIVKDKAGNLQNSLFLNLTKLLNDLISLFCEDLYEIINKCRDFKDKTFTDTVTNDLVDKIALLSEGLNKFHIDLTDLYDQIPQPVDDSQDTNDLFNQVLDKQLDGFNTASDLFNDGQMQIFDFSYKLFQTINFNSDDEVTFDIEKIFNPTINNINNLCQCLITVTSQEEDDENNSTNLSVKWQNLRKDDYVSFLKKEITKESDTLVTALNQFWNYSYRELDEYQSSQIVSQFEKIGDIIIDTIKQRFDIHDPTLKASDISLSFLQAVRYNSDIKDSLQELLVTQIEQVSANLENLRRKQIKMLSNPPTEENIDYFLEDTKDLTTEIEKNANDLNLALLRGREASFDLYQLPEPINKEEGNNKRSEKIKDDVFLLYDNEEGDAIKAHLDSIIELNTTIYSSIEIPYSPGKAPKPSRRKSSGLSSSGDAISVYSSTNSTASSKKWMGSTSSKLSKATMSQISIHMDDPTRTQVIAIEDAMSSTYYQLFASIKGFLIGAIRFEEYNNAKRINDRYLQICLEYQNHLLETKNRASRALDLQTMKDTEQKIQELQNLGVNDLEKIINEGLRSKIEKLVSNYEYNLYEIVDDYNKSVDDAKNSLEINASKLMSEIHIPQLVLLEKQRKIAYEKEKRREVPQFTQLEDQIREFAKKNDFSRANMEKQKLETMRKEELTRRVEEIDKTYDSKKKTLLKDQQKDLHNLEQSYNQKIIKIKQRRDAEFNNQMDRLSSALKSRIQKDSRFASEILPDQQSKKDVSKKLEKIAYDVIQNKSNKFNKLDTLLEKRNAK